MRNFLFGVSLALVAVQVGHATCLDTTLVLTAGAPGFATPPGGLPTYTPGAANAINAVIAGCSDAAITVHLKFSDPAHGDTLRLANEITVNGRSGKSTRIVAEGTNDSMVTLLETSVTDPNLILVNPGNTTILSGLGFARKATGSGTPTGSGTASVIIAANGSQVVGCHFWMADNQTQSLSPLLDIDADSVLVERCLFRAPPDGPGRSVAIHTAAYLTNPSANRVEIRSNVFFSTGLQLVATGTVHVIANTFSGSREGASAITIGSSVANPGQGVVIMHNLFAARVDTLSPIAFSGNLTSSDSILRNAWSRGRTNLPLAYSGASGGASITLNNNTGSNINTPLPRGFSNYGPSSTEIKDYPLTELRSDPTLARKNADFGKIFRVFINSNWTTMSDIKDLPASKLYFPSFAPFLAGKTWLPSVKVGAFVDQDSYETPAPLDSGSRGSALAFDLYGDGTSIKVSKRSFDANYYKTSSLTPEFMYYFFSDTLSALTASNDSNALKTSTHGAFIRRPFLGDDSILVVPREVRNDSNSIFVKMLHYRQGQQAPVRSDAAIATVSKVPSYPKNDLTLKVEPTSDFVGGNVTITVTRGGEAIDSVRVVTATEGGQIDTMISKPATGTTLTFNFKVDKGTRVFYAIPIAKLGSVTKPGQPTQNSPPYIFQVSPSDTVFVSYRTGSCAGADGTQSNGYCSLDSALKDIATKKGTTIIIKNGTPLVPMEDIVIAPTSPTDTTQLTIMALPVSGKYDVNRPIFRGKTKEAITITRKNVILKGFFIEMPAGSANTALNVKASGAQIEGNIFRASANGSVDGAALNVDVGATGELRFLNNIVWAFGKNVLITNTASQNVRIINNTFVEVAALNAGKGTGISLAGTGAVTAVFANNFFSGLTTPIEATLTGKLPILDHNVFTHKGDLAGIPEIGLDTSSYRIGARDIWGSNYVVNLEAEFSNAIECSSINPCNPIYGGSSSSTYNTTVNTDFIGKPRLNKKEVGAYEYGAASSVMGVLSISPTLTDNYQKISYVVTGESFDPSEADSVYVFWSTSDLNGHIDAGFSNVPASQRKQYPISKLGSGNLSDVAEGLTQEGAPYYFYAALGRTGSSRLLGYAYSASIVSKFNVDTSDCKFATSNSACPSAGGVFTPKNTKYSNIQTKVLMTEPVPAGSQFNNPVFLDIVSTKVFNLDLSTPMPYIVYNSKISGLGAAGSKQMFTATMIIDGLVDLSDKNLFLIPDSGSNTLPKLISTWSSTRVGDKTMVTIESNMDGVQKYAFGVMQPTVAPGVIATTDAAVPVFDFTAAKDSSILHIPVKFKGSGFKTANPLILISVIPAGGAIEGVLDGTYHSPSVILTNGFTGLTDSLKDDRFYKYYLKAAAAEANSTVPGGHRKPFTLDSVPAGDFAKAVLKDPQDIAVTGTGEMGEIAVSLPISKSFKDDDKYADKKGKASRSLEVEYTVFDGATLSRSRSFIQTSFTEANLHISEKATFQRNVGPRWSLFGYPWDESADPQLGRLMAAGKWDPDHFRLWQYKGSGAGAGAFESYTGSNAGDFKIDSGRAVWAGSTREYIPTTAGGKSLDYQPFSLALTAGQWNDLSLPFNFPMFWKDILDSSGLTKDSDVPAWKYVPGTLGAGKWDPLTMGSASPPVASSVLLPWQGFSAKPLTAVTLKFPILDSIRSAPAAAPKAATPKAAAKPAVPGDQSWSALLSAYNGSAEMNLRIGKGMQESKFPEAPDVPGQNFRVALKLNTLAGEEKVSRAILSQDGSWQGHWALETLADKGAKGISLSIADASRQVPIYLVDALHKSATPLSTTAPIQVSEDEMRANDYHLVAGDEQYLKSVLDGLVPLHLLALSNYPNPFAGSTLIRYALPESFGKVEFNLKVRDFRGRTVWEKTVKGGNSLSYLWDGRDKLNSPLPAGVYTLALEASAAGKPAFKANRRILRM